MAQLHRNLFIGIDGVDECEPSERRCILSLVHNLLKLSDTELDLKVFLASCTEKDIEESLQLSTHLALKPHHLDSDIRSYIDIRSIAVGEAFSFNKERVHEVACKVAGRPKGLQSFRVSSENNGMEPADEARDVSSGAANHGQFAGARDMGGR